MKTLPCLTALWMLVLATSCQTTAPVSRPDSPDFELDPAMENVLEGARKLGYVVIGTYTKRPGGNLFIRAGSRARFSQGGMFEPEPGTIFANVGPFPMAVSRNIELGPGEYLVGGHASWIKASSTIAYIQYRTDVDCGRKKHHIRDDSSWRKASSTLSNVVATCEWMSSILPESKKGPASPMRGRNEVRFVNPNEFAVLVGLRRDSVAINLLVLPNETAAVVVGGGSYEMYFVYSNQRDALFQGDGVDVTETAGVEITLDKVLGGNCGIRRVN